MSRTSSSPADRKQTLLVSVVVAGAVGVLTLVLRQTVGTYVARPLAALYTFVRTFVDVIPQRGQAAIFVAIVGLVTVFRFASDANGPRPQRRAVRRGWEFRKALGAASPRSKTLIGRWANEVAPTTNYDAKLLADHLRSLIVTIVGPDDPFAPPEVRAVLAGMPPWLKPTKKSRIQRPQWFPISHTARERVAPIQPHLIVIMTYLQRHAGLQQHAGVEPTSNFPLDKVPTP